MSVEVIDGVHFETTSSNKRWCNCIHLGAIIDQGCDQLAINYSLANIFWSQPSVPGVLIPVTAGSIPAGS